MALYVFTLDRFPQAEQRGVTSSPPHVASHMAAVDVGGARRGGRAAKEVVLVRSMHLDHHVAGGRRSARTIENSPGRWAQRAALRARAGRARSGEVDILGRDLTTSLRRGGDGTCRSAG